MSPTYASGAISLFIDGNRVDTGSLEVTDLGTDQPEPDGIAAVVHEPLFEASGSTIIEFSGSGSWQEMTVALAPFVTEPPASVLEVDGLPVGRVLTGTMALEGNELSMDVVPLTVEYLATTDRLNPEALRNWLRWAGYHPPAEMAAIEGNPMFGQVLARDQALAREWLEAREPLPSAPEVRAHLERGRPARIARARHWRQIRAADAHRGPTPEQRRKAKRQAQRQARQRQR